ncbi:MAG: S24/S26 family peptidase [Gemmatimonadaceae bacterium]
MWIVAHGGSMQPRIRDGDRVLVQARPARMRAGMVLLVDRNGRPLMHRLARWDDFIVVLRPDTLEHDDPPVPVRDVVGRAVAVSRDGRITPLVSTLQFGAAAWLRYAREQVRAARLALRRRARRAIVGPR